MFAFLDNELDVERNLDVLEHLNMCHECGLKMEKERYFQKKVKETVCRTHTPAYLEQRIAGIVERRSNFFLRWIKHFAVRGKLVPIAGATAMILAICFVILQGNLKKPDVLAFIDTTYHNYLMGRLDVDIRSQDDQEILAYIQKMADSQITLPGIQGIAQLVGAGVSEMKGTKILLAFYQHEGAPIMVYFDCNLDIDFTELKEVKADITLYTGTTPCGMCQIVGWKEGGNQYVMISNLKNEKLIQMFTRA